MKHLAIAITGYVLFVLLSVLVIRLFDTEIYALLITTYAVFEFIRACIGYYNLHTGLNRVTEWRRGGWIYIFSDFGQVVPTIKIGRASDRDNRLNSHATAAPFGIIIWARFKVTDSVQAENYLKHRYQFWRMKNNVRLPGYQNTSKEWYHCVPFSKIFWEILLMRVFR